jgi:hypothetical protein
MRMRLPMAADEWFSDAEQKKGRQALFHAYPNVCISFKALSF